MHLIFFQNKKIDFIGFTVFIIIFSNNVVGGKFMSYFKVFRVLFNVSICFKILFYNKITINSMYLTSGV